MLIEVWGHPLPSLSKERERGGGISYTQAYVLLHGISMYRILAGSLSYANTAAS
jgi:hypothetical protein